VTSVWIFSDLVASSLQGHCSAGFDGAGLWSECPESCFDFAAWCLWAQHGLVIRAVRAEEWEDGAGLAGWKGDANNRPAVQQQSNGPAATAIIS